MFKGTNITHTNVVGIDFVTGTFTHTVRFEYLKTELHRADATSSSNLPFAGVPLELQMGSTGLVVRDGTSCCYASAQRGKKPVAHFVFSNSSCREKAKP